MNKKNIFLTSTLILVFGGFITRSIGFVIRIIYTRAVGPEGIALFSIVMPTYSFLITIATLSLPLSISKIVAEKKKRSVSILSNAIILVVILNFLLVTLTIISSDFIANNLLHVPEAKFLLIAMSLTLPFASITSIIKGYFLGKQNATPYMISNILEQILRLVIILFLIPYLLNFSVLHAVVGLILLSVISETFSIIVFMFFLPKNIKIKKEDLVYNKDIKNNILQTSIPIVSGKIIGNVGYFFEPIILTNFLIFSGYSSNFILAEYGAFNAYAISLLTMPAFFIQAISQTIIPEVSKFKSTNNTFMIKKRSIQVLKYTTIIGIIFSTGIFLFRDTLLTLLYNTTLGSDYIKILAPFFILFYLEGVLYSILQAIGKAKIAFMISFKGVVIKLVFLSILSLCKIGLYSLVIAEIINIFYIVIANLNVLKKENII